MIKTKDLSLIIIMAVVGFVSAVSFNQLAGLITGIAGANFLFVISLAIQTSFSTLMYEGRRWRFFIQFSIFSLLTVPTSLGGTPFDLINRIPQIFTAFLADIGINSIYGIFKKKNQLKAWAISTTLAFWLAMPFIGILTMPLYLPSEAVTNFIQIVVILLPVIIVESSFGGYLGYKIYKRVKNIDQ